MSKDGYYVRTVNGDTHGPLAEDEFERIQRTPAAKTMASAYRLAGGHPYQLTVGRRVKFDRRHALSCRAVGYVGEIAVVLLCFGVTTMMVVLLRSEPLQAEREAAGAALIWVIGLLALSTLGIGALAVIRLTQRWRQASSYVFTCEV